MSSEPRTLFFRHIVRKIFLEDWVLKLVALVITFGLWFGVAVVSKGKEASDRFTVPLNFRVLDNAAVTSAPVQEVEIHVRGLDDHVQQIRRCDISVLVDLTDLLPGERVLLLTPENVSVQLPEGVKLVDLQPSRIAVNIEAIEERDIAVKAVTDGAPPTGFEVYGDPLISPEKVKVRGPASLVGAVDQLLTEKIPLDGRREAFTVRQIPVGVSNNKVTIFNTVVDVTFRIGEIRVRRAISIPIQNQPGKTATAILYGPRTLVAKLKQADIKVELVKNGDGSDVPQFDLPPEIEIQNARIEP